MRPNNSTIAVLQIISTVINALPLPFGLSYLCVVEDSDYFRNGSVQVIFPSGTSSVPMVQCTTAIVIIDDDIIEGDEIIFFYINAPQTISNATVMTLTAHGRVTIHDNEGESYLSRSVPIAIMGDVHIYTCTVYIGRAAMLWQQLGEHECIAVSTYHLVH